MNNEIANKIYELEIEIQKWTGENYCLSSISVDPGIFDMLVVDAYKQFLSPSDERDGAMAMSSFTPSDAFNFRLAGVRILPYMEI